MATDTSDAVDNLEKELVTLARRLRGLQRTLSDEAHPDLEPAQYALLYERGAGRLRSALDLPAVDAGQKLKTELPNRGVGESHTKALI